MVVPLNKSVCVRVCVHAWICAVLEIILCQPIVANVCPVSFDYGQTNVQTLDP